MTASGARTPYSAAPSAVGPLKDGQLPSSRRMVVWSARVLVACALVVGAGSAFTLVVGWAFGVTVARTIVPGATHIWPTAALALLLFAVSLAGTAPGATRRSRVIAGCCAITGAAISVATLAEHATGADLLLDRALFSDAVRELGGVNPGRLGFGAALCLTLLAVAHLALLTGSHRGTVVSQALALGAGLAGLITFDNLLHGSLSASGQTIGPGWMGAVSAAGVTLLALGTVLARPRVGLLRAITSAGVAGVVGRRMLLAAATVPFALGWVPELIGTLGVRGERSGLLFLIGASVAIFATISFAATGAAARLETGSIRASEETRAGHAQLLTLIDNTSAVIYIRDLEGRYILANREYERLFGVQREEIQGLTDHDLFPAPMADAFLANDRLALASAAPLLIEEEAPQDDGPHTYITVKFPLTDAAGVAYAVCGISTDITARKRAEEEVRLLNSQLELRVRERTEELEASARELDAFAYSVSHDLRAPLRSVDGFSQILLEDYADLIDAKGQDYLQRLRAATQRMGRLIDDLLQLSRTTRSELRRERVDLTELASSTVAELRAADPDRDVAVVIENGMSAPGDRQLLGLVMENLLSNAWKFTEKSAAPRIEVSSIRDGTECGFQVSDNGAGFDMRYVDKLFGAFQRLHSSADFEGTGVGLATVQRIVLRHGGDVRAVGEPGKGATFTVTLPTRFVAEPESRTQQSLRLEHSH